MSKDDVISLKEETKWYNQHFESAKKRAVNSCNHIYLYLIDCIKTFDIVSWLVDWFF